MSSFMGQFWWRESPAAGQSTAASTVAAPLSNWRMSWSEASIEWCWRRRRVALSYRCHRHLREIGVEAFVVATESISGKRKTNRRDAGKLLDQL